MHGPAEAGPEGMEVLDEAGEQGAKLVVGRSGGRRLRYDLLGRLNVGLGGSGGGQGLGAAGHGGRLDLLLGEGDGTRIGKEPGVEARMERGLGQVRARRAELADVLGVLHGEQEALECAEGEFVAFLDPDDWYPEPDILESMYVTAKENNVDICGGGWTNH